MYIISILDQDNEKNIYKCVTFYLNNDTQLRFSKSLWRRRLEITVNSERVNLMS